MSEENKKSNNIKQTIKKGTYSFFLITLSAIAVKTYEPIKNVFTQAQSQTSAPLITDGKSTEITVYDNKGNPQQNISLPCQILIRHPEAQKIKSYFKKLGHFVFPDLASSDSLLAFSDTLIQAHYIDKDGKSQIGYFNPNDIGKYTATISNTDLDTYSYIVEYIGPTGTYPISSIEDVELVRGDYYLTDNNVQYNSDKQPKLSLLNATTGQTVLVPYDMISYVTLGHTTTVGDTPIKSDNTFTVPDGTNLEILSTTRPSEFTSVRFNSSDPSNSTFGTIDSNNLSSKEEGLTQ